MCVGGGGGVVLYVQVIGVCYVRVVLMQVLVILVQVYLVYSWLKTSFLAIFSHFWQFLIFFTFFEMIIID